MLNLHVRAPLGRILDPIGARLARTRLTPDLITVLGTVGAVVGALAFFTRGAFLIGSLWISFFVMADMLDGALARARGSSSRWGAFLDSTLDRVADAAIFGALAFWFGSGGDNSVLAAVSLVCLVGAAVTSYIKARAEGLGMTCNVGFAERTERLIIVLLGTGLAGLGVPYVQALALWLLAAASLVTVGQRLVEVRRQALV